MKTYTPKGLGGADLRGLLDELGLSPAQAAKHLKVTERSVFRWLADGSAPFAVVALLWHLSADGRASVACDLGNELVIYRGLAQGRGESLSAEAKRLAYLVRLGDFGAANDPLMTGPARSMTVAASNPWRVSPLSLDPVAQGWQLPHHGGGDDGSTQHNQGFA